MLVIGAGNSRLSEEMCGSSASVHIVTPVDVALLFSNVDVLPKKDGNDSVAQRSSRCFAACIAGG